MASKIFKLIYGNAERLPSFCMTVRNSARSLDISIFAANLLI